MRTQRAVWQLGTVPDLPDSPLGRRVLLQRLVDIAEIQLHRDWPLLPLGSPPIASQSQLVTRLQDKVKAPNGIT